MGASAALTPSTLVVVPGVDASLEVRVRNTGTVVDEFTLEVLGDAAAWATVVPDKVSLFPGGDATATVIFRPPVSSDVPSGQVPFGVRVASKEDPAGSVAEEGTLDVQPFTAVAASLVPRTVRGSRRAAAEVAVENRGNAPLSATLVAADPDQNLVFEVDPPAVSADAGQAQFAKVKIRPKTRFRRGPAQTRMFQVHVMQDESVLAVADGMMVQEGTEPPWLRKAIAWALIGLIAFLLLWFTLLKPTVETAAKEAVKEESAPPTIGTGDGGGASNGGGGGGGGSEDGGGGGEEPSTGGVVGAGTPIAGRLFLTESGTKAYEVPAGQTLQLTDIILQNPQGNTGTLEIRRNGEPLIVVELGNFRDLDYHFVSPFLFGPGQKLELSATCSSPTCTPGATFSGFITGG